MDRHLPTDRLTVVGCGLVGSLLSIFLAKKGYFVDAYERRSDLRVDSKENSGRSINLALSARGIHALAAVGMADPVLKLSIPMTGRMIHPLEGDVTFQPYGRDDSECIYSVSRKDLNQMLMTEAEATERVSLHFNRRLTAVDFESRFLRFEDGASGIEDRLGFNVLLASDGSASSVRSAMNGGGTVESYLEYGYKELTIPPRLDQEGEASFQLAKNALHIWPRGTDMLIALPNRDGSFTCTLFLPFEGKLSFESLTSPDAIEGFFMERFPDAATLMPGFVGQFFRNPTGQMVTVRTSPWRLGGKCLLLGDAAHAIVPFFGQGMNCGFEDCSILAGLLGREGDTHLNWAGVFQRFEELRRPNADAIADLALENFVEMRDKVSQPRFLLKKGVERILERKFAGDYVSRYSLVTFSRIPYRLAKQVGIIEDELLEELCANIQSPEEVNLGKAEELISIKLKPVLSG